VAIYTAKLFGGRDNLTVKAGAAEYTTSLKFRKLLSYEKVMRGVMTKIIAKERLLLRT
jgi:hypothetical protein